MFLKEYNGVIPKTRVVACDTNDYVVERFLCFFDKPGMDLVNGWYDINAVIAQIGDRLIEDGDMLGMNVIPIAALFAGDFVCLDFRESSQPTVAVWLHEESDELSPVLIKVADSFGQFIEMLKEDSGY